MDAYIQAGLVAAAYLQANDERNYQKWNKIERQEALRADITITQDIQKQGEQELRRIEHDVAADVVKQYEIAKRSGSAMDAYIQAGLVAALYLQAKDERNYQKWEEIERQEALRAGINSD